MSKQEVRKKGGIFNILNGYTWESYSVEGIRMEDVYIVLSPRVGSHNVGITSGVHKPGMEFAPHVHPLSEELVFCHEGSGEFYLYDRWYPVKKGDVLYAPPGVKHGTRNPADNTENFVTIGVATPPQLDLYNRIGYDVLAEDDE